MVKYKDNLFRLLEVSQDICDQGPWAWDGRTATYHCRYCGQSKNSQHMHFCMWAEFERVLQHVTNTLANKEPPDE